MSFILESTILFSAVEWGIKDRVDKLICDEFESLVTHGMTNDSTKDLLS